MLRSGMLCVAALASLGAVAARAQTPDQADKPKVAVMVDQPQISEYWLGIMAVPADELLRKQLNLPENEGLIVAGVFPEGPAAKAGIVQHDVLLRFGQRPLGDLDDLIKAVADAGDTAQKVELIRGGKRQSVEVAPARRPAAERRQTTPPSEDDWAIVQRWFESMKPGAGGGFGRTPVRFRFFHPGAIVSDEMVLAKKMPANLSIAIRKTGEQPARIEVRRDDDKWELTEKDLDQLPDDVRPFVERMLGGNVMWSGGLRAFDMVPDVMVPVPPGARGQNFTMPAPPSGQMPVAPLPDMEQRLQRRFDEMNRRMDRMIEMMEQMLGVEEPPEEE
ncbi:MAG: PDZ domain-containing protein [Pirellulales bacterium]|nr:PDZ domain-containing protein [Pirellulales bacterium]